MMSEYAQSLIYPSLMILVPLDACQPTSLSLCLVRSLSSLLRTSVDYKAGIVIRFAISRLPDCCEAVTPVRPPDWRSYLTRTGVWVVLCWVWADWWRVREKRRAVWMWVLVRMWEEISRTKGDCDARVASEWVFVRHLRFRKMWKSRKAWQCMKCEIYCEITWNVSVQW